MKAMVIERYGPPEALQFADLPEPEPGRGELRIRVRAAAVNPIDCLIRSGALRWVQRQRFPLVLGFDVAGEVDAVGPGVSGWQVGQRVYARTDRRAGGCYAERVVTGADSAAPMPTGLSFPQAAALPLVSLTALQALERARVQPGHEVLVNGASGGVGSVAVQIARAMGARVTAVSSAAHAALVGELGAQHVIDYRQSDFTRGNARYDVVFDVVSNRSYLECRRVLTERGVYVALLPSPSRVFWALATRLGRRRVVLFDMRPSGAGLRRVKAWVEAGALRPVVARVLPLTEVARAHALCESKHAGGKLVLSVAATAEGGAGEESRGLDD